MAGDAVTVCPNAVVAGTVLSPVCGKMVVDSLFPGVEGGKVGAVNVTCKSVVSGGVSDNPGDTGVTVVGYEEVNGMSVSGGGVTVGDGAADDVKS